MINHTFIQVVAMGNIEENMTIEITFKPDPKAFAKAYAEFLKRQEENK